MADVVSNFAAGMEFKYLGMIPIIDGIWWPLLLVGSVNPLTASLRHLRTLPMSWGTLNALMLVSSLAYLLGAIASLAILHLAVLGSLPHIDAGPVVLALGMASFGHTWQLPFGRRFNGFLNWVPMLVIIEMVGLALPVLPAVLASPVVIGTLLTLMAAVANAWLLTRSSSYMPSRNEQVFTPTY